MMLNHYLSVQMMLFIQQKKMEEINIILIINI
jgi:hypothetical protein